MTNDTGQRRFVAGSLGPLPVTGSMSPDVNNPAFRAVSFDQLRQTYFDQATALLEGNVDLLIVETIFDTLNTKAALFAISEAFEKSAKKAPLMISGAFFADFSNASEMAKSAALVLSVSKIVSTIRRSTFPSSNAVA